MSFFQSMCQMSGYEPKTTFWDDFTIAEKIGSDAIRDAYTKIMAAWKSNYIYLTELVMVLNWNIWYWDGAGTKQSEEFAKLYNELWNKADEYALEHLAGNELQYFLRTVD